MIDQPHSITYRTWKPQDQQVIARLIHELYQGGSGEPVNMDNNIRRTFKRLTQHPDNGTIIVFESQDSIIGYAILLHFWSNEYGGMLLYIDELYVIPDFRGKRIATEFIHYLSNSRFYDNVALKLEVLPYNAHALRLYEKLGFIRSDRSYLQLDTKRLA